MLRFLTKKSSTILFIAILFVFMSSFIGIIEADFVRALMYRASIPNINPSETSAFGISKNIVALYNLGTLKLSLLVVGITLFSLIAGILGVLFIAKATTLYIANVRYETYRQIQKFSFQDIDKFSTPSLITRTTTDAELVSISFSFSARFLTHGLFTFVFGLVKSIIDYPDLSLIYVGLLPFLLIILSFTIWKAIPYFRRSQTFTDKVNGSVRDSILGIRVIKAYNLETDRKVNFKTANENLSNNSIKAFTIVGLLMPIVQGAVNAAQISIYIIAFSTINNPSEFINISGFTTILLQVLFGFIISIVSFVQISRSIPSMMRIMEVAKHKPSISFDDSSKLKIVNGDIEFKNVSYSFHENPTNESYVLKNINLKIKSKERIGIVGGTGSGKSTLINLLARLFDTTSGEILIDGINIKKFSFDELNKNISIAMQQAVLFSGTIESNISMGLPLDLSEEERVEKAMEAAKAAEAWEFISKKPDTLNYTVEQRGKNFSGGQKQRISIARTIAKKSKIIIFDDSTSALDTITERKVQENIQKYNEATTIIVAQRISSVEELDKIIVLDKGEIVGFDSHWKLLENNDVYRSIAASQIGTEELNEILIEKGVKPIEKKWK